MDALPQDPDFRDSQLSPENELAVLDGARLPPAIVRLGEKAAESFIEFFVASLSNQNTRLAYYRAISRWLHWLDESGLALSPSPPHRAKSERKLPGVRTSHVAAYVESLKKTYETPTVKQHLAAIKQFCNFMVIHQHLDRSPAAGVRGPIKQHCFCKSPLAGRVIGLSC